MTKSARKGRAGAFLRSLKPSEEEIHRSVAQWVRYNEHRYKPLELMFHSPNGGGRSKAEAGVFKAMLVRPGVPDLMLPYGMGGHWGLAVELKSAKGKLTDNQRDYIKLLEEAGWLVATCYSYEQAVTVIEGYLKGEERRGM